MNRKNKKIFKRVISLAIATVLLLNSTLVYELSDFIGLDGIDMIAHAAVPDIDPDPTITTVNELINYSEVYRDHPANHQFDTVTIGLTGDTSGAFSDFVSIGTSEYPFGGKIVINSISSSDVMNLNTAFFDYVYDYAEIEGQGDRVFTLATTSDNTTSAIFANHVMHDNGNAHSNKNGECYAYSDDDAETQNGKIIKNYAA